MPYFQQLDRERTRERARTRPTAPGNFITFRKGGNLYGVLFPLSTLGYVKYQLYPKVDSHPFGYLFDPPGPYPYFLIGPVTGPDSLIPPDITAPTTPPTGPPGVTPPGGPGTIIQPTPIQPPAIPPGTTPVTTIAFSPGDASTILTKTTPQQIVLSYFPIKLVFIRNLDSSAAEIWVNFRQNVRPFDGFKLAPGEGRVIPVNDLSKIYFVGLNNTDRFEFAYLV